MPEDWRYWAITGLAGLALVLVVVNIVLSETNRTLQASVNARAQYLQQTAQLETLGREMITAVAKLAVQNKDDQLRAVLENHGIRVNVNPPAPPAASTSGVAPGRPAPDPLGSSAPKP